MSTEQGRYRHLGSIQPLGIREILPYVVIPKLKLERHHSSTSGCQGQRLAETAALLLTCLLHPMGLWGGHTHVVKAMVLILTMKPCIYKQLRSSRYTCSEFTRSLPCPISPGCVSV